MIMIVMIQNMDEVEDENKRNKKVVYLVVLVEGIKYMK